MEKSVDDKKDDDELFKFIEKYKIILNLLEIKIEDNKDFNLYKEEIEIKTQILLYNKWHPFVMLHNSLGTFKRNFCYVSIEESFKKYLEEEILNETNRNICVIKKKQDENKLIFSYFSQHTEYFLKDFFELSLISKKSEKI